MLEKLSKKNYFFPLLLVLISLILYLTNFTPGTYLVGWDNLFPELNFTKAFKVNLFGIWQWYRGLGAEDGLAHAASLPHTIFMFLLSKLLPLNTLRYTFQILMHLLGGLGIYFLIYRYKHNQLLAFIGALFYELNLATIQMFYAPLEVFSTHFAALPWLLYLILSIFEKRTKAKLIGLFLLSLITTTQGFVPTVFIAYGFAVFSVITTAILSKGKNSIKTAILIVSIIFFTNAFWMLPFVHSALTQGNTIKNSKINQLSSDSIYERNKRRGSILDLLYLKGFMLDTVEDNLQKKQEFIMQSWNKHINQPYVFLILSFFSTVFVIGVINTLAKLIKHKNFTFETYFLPLLLISIFMLGSRVPILSFFSSLARDKLPLFGEAFRFPITKFFIVYSFTYTIFLLSGIEYLLAKKSNYQKALLCSIAVLIIIYSFPAFRGNFFFSALRLKIPPEYFQTIEYFKAENKSGRIMTLPQATFWNWMFYSWGNRGSGFLWYGIEQPMLERPFDPWNNFNEQYYNETFYALQTENENLFRNVVNKYDISYILIDGNRNVESKVQQKEKIESYINRVIPHAEPRHFGKITIYKLTGKKPTALQTENFKQSAPFYYEFKDSFYEKHANYITTNDWEAAYLFPSLFTNKTQEDLNFKFEEQADGLVLKPKNKLNLGLNTTTLYFTADDYPTDGILIPVRAQLKDGKINIDPIGVKIKIENFEKEIKPFETTSVDLQGLDTSAIKSVRLNGNSIDITDSNSYALAFGHLENSLYLEIEGKSGIRKDFTLIKENNKNQFPVPLTSEQLDYQIKYPVVRPDRWNTNNVFEGKTYLVETPCPDDIQKGIAKYKETDSGLDLTTQTSSACMHEYLTGITQNLGVYFNLNAKNLSGSPLYFVVDNPQQNSNIIDTKLHPQTSRNIIIVPPTSKYLYSDYGTHFRNSSAGTELTHNKISWMNVGYLPYSWIKTFRFVKNINPTTAVQAGFEIDPTLEAKFIYSAEIPDSNSLSADNQYFYLSQSFNPSWQAYQIKKDPSEFKMWIRSTLPFLYGKKLTQHVLVNNWANGWKISNQPSVISSRLELNTDNRTQITVVFWPQYLQFFGFIILLIGFFTVLRIKKNNHG